jgi:hypothetical protein
MVQPNPAACEQAWQRQLPQQQQQQRRKQPGSAKFQYTRLMAGEMMGLLAEAAKTDKVIRAVYSKQTQKWCGELKHTGNKACHKTNSGEVMIADANMGLWALKQLLLALLQAPLPAGEAAPRC